MDDKELLRKLAEKNLRACQLKQLEILKVIDGICKRNGIQYWLDSGTLLGAVRHGGFIPWDDDIDIVMPLGDLRRFERVAAKELPDDLFLQTTKTDPSAKEPIVKVRDLQSLYIEGGDNFVTPYKKGIYVDIFPFVPYPDLAPGFFHKVIPTISKSNSILHHFHRYSLRAFAEFFWFGGKLCVGWLMWGLLSLYPKKSRMGTAPLVNGTGNTHRRSSIFPLTTIRFEDSVFPAPADTDAYLRDLFGDYMQIPPADKRQVHAVYINPDLRK